MEILQVAREVGLLGWEGGGSSFRRVAGDFHFRRRAYFLAWG